MNTKQMNSRPCRLNKLGQAKTGKPSAYVARARKCKSSVLVPVENFDTSLARRFITTFSTKKETFAINEIEKTDEGFLAKTKEQDLHLPYGTLLRVYSK